MNTKAYHTNYDLIIIFFFIWDISSIRIRTLKNRVSSFFLHSERVLVETTLDPECNNTREGVVAANNSSEKSLFFAKQLQSHLRKKNFAWFDLFSKFNQEISLLISLKRWIRSGERFFDLAFLVIITGNISS